jgi:hypothetical protein
MTYQIGIYDHATGEQLTRDMTAEEIADFEAGKINKQTREKAEAQAKTDKLAILSDLGLTETQAIVLGLLPEAVKTTARI